MVPNVWQINISTRFHHPESNHSWKTSKKTFPVLGTGKQAVGLQKLNVVVTQHKPPEGKKKKASPAALTTSWGRGVEVSREVLKLTQNSPLRETEDE